MRLKLIPLVVFAALGLLSIKAMELYANGTVLMAGLGFGQEAIPRMRMTEGRPNLLRSWDVTALTDRGIDKMTTASESAPAEGEATAAKPGEVLKPSVVKVQVDDQRPKEADPPIGGESSTEARLLEKLGERRKLIEQREREIEVREGLLKATEGKIEQKIDDLKTMSEKISVSAKSNEDPKGKELADLVKMYESMKAKDAARVFDKLEKGLLVDIARSMNPKKLADVVAKMSVDSAERLTVGLANRESKDPPATQSIELPKIEGHDS